MLRSDSKKGARPKEPEIVDPDEEETQESVSERVARLITHQVVARGSVV